MANDQTALNMSSIKAPPHFSEDCGYEQYKKELEIWQLLKVCKKTEEGPLIFRTLPQKAKSTVIDLVAKWITSILQRAGDSPDQPYILKTAFTGTAASNIGL